MDSIFQTTKIMRTKVLYGMNIAIAISALLLAITNVIFNNNYAVASFEVILSCLCLAVYISLKKSVTYNKWHLVSIPAFFTITVTVALLSLDIESGIIFWIYTFPILFYLLFGTKYGFLCSIALLFIQTIIIYYKLDSAGILNFRIFLNMYLANSIIIATSHVFERYRSTSQRQLIELTIRDPLTNALNRLGLKEHFQSYLKSKNPVALALVDIDFFKHVNDKYGHDAGDFILVQLTAICQKTIGDNKVFRMGGEEFVVLIEGHSNEGLKKINELRETIQQTSFQFTDDIKLNIAFSAGYIHINELENNKQEPLSEMITIADERLYKAKESGRNRVVSE